MAGTDDLVSRNEILRTEIDELAQVSNRRNSFDAMRRANVLATWLHRLEPPARSGRQTVACPFDVFLSQSGNLFDSDLTGKLLSAVAIG